jgi:tRNA (uracil-5-)-methyltransferase TRM9
MDSTISDEAEIKEQQHVHQVYQEIAAHFSDTRYKPWPIVEKFLLAQPNGSVGLDIGCGNGKYMTVNKEVVLLGSDRSSELVRLARAERNVEVMMADALRLPFRKRTFSFAISIAVIHHFSTPQRRIESLGSILSILEPTGQALVYVWALEQKNSRRGWDEGMAQDVMVPWVLNKKGKNDHLHEKPVIKHRYYHLYRKGELESDVEAANGVVVESGYEKDNWWAIIKRK